LNYYLLFFDQRFKRTTSLPKMRFSSTIVALNVAALTNALAIAPRQNNVQTFSGALGGAEATPVLQTGDANRPFSVKDATFANLGAALQRSCDQQFNACANLANGGDETLSVAQCQAQKGKLKFEAKAGRICVC
jgi:hypothetical protein